MNQTPRPPSPRDRPLDRETFARLYAEAYPRLVLVGQGMLGDRGLAEDAVQEAVVLALGKLHDFSPGTYFTAWLSQFVRHVALNQRRWRKRRTALSLDHEAATPPPAPPLPEGNTTGGPIDAVGRLGEDRGHFDDRVHAGLATLKPDARACLLLRTVGGLDYTEIAEVLDIPRGTAMSHVHRARQTLRRRLDTTEVTGDTP